MIILRQKRYSNPVVRKGVRKLGYGLVDLRDSIYNVIYRNNPQRQITSRLIREQGERNAVNLSNNLARLIPGNLSQAESMATAVGGSAKEAAKKSVGYIRTHSVDQMVGDFGHFSSSHPVQAAATMATFPATGAALEGGLQKNKVYRKITNWTGRQYNRFLRAPVQAATKTIATYPEYLPVITSVFH